MEWKYLSETQKRSLFRPDTITVKYVNEDGEERNKTYTRGGKVSTENFITGWWYHSVKFKLNEVIANGSSITVSEKLPGWAKDEISASFSIPSYKTKTSRVTGKVGGKCEWEAQTKKKNIKDKGTMIWVGLVEINFGHHPILKFEHSKYEAICYKYNEVGLEWTTSTKRLAEIEKEREELIPKRQKLDKEFKEISEQMNVYLTKNETQE